jgi:hypothetical protein
MITEHSKTFGFSAAPRWVNCNGSIKLAEGDPPQEDTQDTREGTAAHHVAEQMLNAFKIGQNWFEIGAALIGVADPDGTIIDDDMFDAALTYVQIIVKVVGNDPERRKYLFIELKVKSTYLDPEAWGTSDAIFYDVTTNTLYVWDFKYGHGSVVAFENYQLLGYAQAAVEIFNYKRLNPRLSLHIVQPRCYDGQGALRSWEIAFDFIRTYINKMSHAIQTYRMGKPLCVSGPWCRDCEVGHKCPSLTGASAVAVDLSHKPIPLEFAAEGLAYEKTVIDAAIDRMTQRKSAIDALMEKRVRGGELIPGFCMEQQYGFKGWNQPIKNIFMMGDLLKVNLRKPEAAISPTQAITLLKKAGHDTNTINAFYSVPKTGSKLVPDDGSKAAQIFSQEKLNVK